MGVLDKLMFWKDKTDSGVGETEFEIDGCFTLPEARSQPVAESLEAIVGDTPADEDPGPSC